MNLTLERTAKINAAVSALGSLFETNPGDGYENNCDEVVAARVLRSGWIGDYFFSISNGGGIVRFWHRSSVRIPPYSINARKWR